MSLADLELNHGDQSGLRLSEVCLPLLPKHRHYRGEPPCHAGLDTVKRSTLPGKQAFSLVLCYTFCRFSPFSHRTMIETATNDV